MVLLLLVLTALVAHCGALRLVNHVPELVRSKTPELLRPGVIWPESVIISPLELLSMGSLDDQQGLSELKNQAIFFFFFFFFFFLFVSFAKHCCVPHMLLHGGASSTSSDRSFVVSFDFFFFFFFFFFFLRLTFFLSSLDSHAFSLGCSRRSRSRCSRVHVFGVRF
jgi:hypothetical protein